MNRVTREGGGVFSFSWKNERLKELEEGRRQGKEIRKYVTN